MDPFHKETLENLTSLQKLDTTLKVVGIREWFILFFIVVLTIGTLVWSVLGTIPITVTGKCIACDPEGSFRVRSPVSGFVRDINVKAGDKVKEGQVLLVLESNGETIPILSKSDALVSWVDVVWGDKVEPDHVLLWIHYQFTPKSIKILGFLPLLSGQQVKPGMVAQTSLDTVNEDRYGLIRGVVKQVLTFPVSVNDFYMEKIPSMPLRQYLIEGPAPTILIIVEPLLDPSTPSGLKWTSEEGPPFAIEPGMIGEVRFILENERPISFLFPRIGLK